LYIADGCHHQPQEDIGRCEVVLKGQEYQLGFEADQDSVVYRMSPGSSTQASFLDSLQSNEYTVKKLFEEFAGEPMAPSKHI
jgi:hypothetical protein